MCACVCLVCLINDVVAFVVFFVLRLLCFCVYFIIVVVSVSLSLADPRRRGVARDRLGPAKELALSPKTL